MSLYPNMLASWPYSVVRAMKGTRCRPKSGCDGGSTSIASKKKPVLLTTEPTMASGFRLSLTCISTSRMEKPGRQSTTTSAPFTASSGRLLMSDGVPVSGSQLSGCLTMMLFRHRSGWRVSSRTSCFVRAATKPVTTCPRLPPPQIQIFIQ